MKFQRQVKFKVCAINMADHEVTLFDCADYKMAEDFAESYVGEHQEVYIKKVFVKSRLMDASQKRPGSEL